MLWLSFKLVPQLYNNNLLSTYCHKAFEEDIIAPQSPVKKKKRGRPRKKSIDDNKKQQEIKTETLDNEEDWKPKKGKYEFYLENHS